MKPVKVIAMLACIGNVWAQAAFAGQSLRFPHPDLALVHGEDIQPARGHEQGVPAFTRADVEGMPALWKLVRLQRKEVIGRLAIDELIGSVPLIPE